MLVILNTVTAAACAGVNSNLCGACIDGAGFADCAELEPCTAPAACRSIRSESPRHFSVYVIRNTNQERIDVFHLDAKNAMALAMADRFDLNAHDIVYVDASDLATWNRIVNLILPTSLLVDRSVDVTKNIQDISRTRWGR